MGKGSKSPEQLIESGRRFHRLGNWVAAFDCYQQALAVEPDSLPLLTNIGFVCHMLNRYGAAAGYHERALAIDPRLVSERYNLGIAYKELLRLQESAECYQQVLNDQPDNVDALHGLGIVKMMQGLAGDADRVLRRALDAKPEDLAVRSCLLLALNYYSGEPDMVAREHLEWDRHNPHHPAVHCAPQGEGRLLRVGYLSPDFCSHPVAFFVEPLLSQHTRSAFQIFCYSDVPRPDGITAHLQKLAHTWRDVHRLSDDALAKQIRRDRIDILVDMAGHTARNRLEVFARKPAPVQVTYLGYPNTTGLAAMNYRLTDAWADPPGESECYYSERLVRLPGGFLCYRPLGGTTVSPLPCRDHGYITFCSFNNLAKVTPEVIALWADVLKTVRDARLILKTRPLQDVTTRELVYRQFAANGIERERVKLMGWTENMGAHLNMYSQVDIALDTFPYNGTTTTCESLWMGVPVITLAGRMHAGRVGTSLLSRAGLPELIAVDKEDYIRKALRLASDREALAKLRDALRERVSSSSLCDAASFVSHVEQAYRKMWKAGFPG